MIIILVDCWVVYEAEAIDYNVYNYIGSYDLFVNIFVYYCFIPRIYFVCTVAFDYCKVLIRGRKWISNASGKGHCGFVKERDPT